MRFNAGVAIICVVCLLVVFSSASVYANPTLSLNWYKDNGYNWGNDIGGQWTITAQASGDVNRVEFYVDNQLQQNSTSSPYKWSFNTADYTLGVHTIKAVGYNLEGQTTIAQAERSFVEYSINSIFVIIGVVIVLMAALLAVLLYRVRKGAKKEKN